VIVGGPAGAWRPTSLVAFPSDLGPLVLKPRTTRLGQFAGTLFAAVFWNGITGVFVWQLVEGFRHGSPVWGLALFLSIFVLIGLGLLLAVPYTFLGLWNPRPHLTLDRGILRLGEAVGFTWRFTGLPGRIRRLRFTLEGREEVAFPSGRSSSTAHEVFHTLEIADTQDPGTIREGSARIAIPADTMHSFTADSNRVVWSLKVVGEIGFWPDLAESFELRVLPQAVRSSP
jgi:hypothetical protein